MMKREGNAQRIDVGMIPERGSNRDDIYGTISFHLRSLKANAPYPVPLGVRNDAALRKRLRQI